MDLEQIRQVATALSEWAYVATVGRDGDPDVVPVHPAWDGERSDEIAGAGDGPAALDDQFPHGVTHDRLGRGSGRHHHHVG